MKIELLILMFFIKSITFEVGLVDCKIYNADLQKQYITYFKQVMNHLRNQIIKSNLYHISIRSENDKIMSIQETLKNRFYGINYSIKIYYIIVELINYLFIEGLKQFTEHLMIIIDNCEHFLKKNLFQIAIYCIVVLLNAVKKSNEMFEYLYKAITFIDYLDMKILNISLIHRKTVVEEIYTVKNYTYKMKTSEIINYVNNDESFKIEKAKEDYKEINNFVNNIVVITREFFKNNINIINNTRELNLREYYYGKYITNDYNMEFVDFISENLNNYYLKTIDDYYFKIGFYELLHPSTADLIPPQKNIFPQYRAIEVLNTLFHKGNWELLKHIRIIVDDEIITTNRIIRDTVNDFNFSLKNKYFTLMMRCRYTEILKNYNTYMSAVLQICKNEKIKSNLKDFVDCIINFLEAVHDSKEMFKNMLIALDILKAESIWDIKCYAHTSLTHTYNLLTIFLLEIEQLMLTRDRIVNLSLNEVELISDELLLHIVKTKYNFNQNIHKLSRFINQRCSIEVLEKYQLIKSWMNEVMLLNINIIECPILIYEYALNKFTTFCDIAITNEKINKGSHSKYNKRQLKVHHKRHLSKTLSAGADYHLGNDLINDVDSPNNMFMTKNGTIVTSQIGGTVILPCATTKSGIATVSLPINVP
ncbi:uncharacterized protein LOC126896634 [Daktulosphaira vitifoliae]|uniref:uncharacterized protein LOC126896634 n=1 Tax=Daktulosphaira vitifoliae TaxID=58002 RepID=UPI0021A98E88|nr:uncharacterized protein LOC126896634 [Daktulosphaira vitifoliae]